MKKKLLLTTLGFVLSLSLLAQNVFDINDPLVRYNASAPAGSPQRPNINQDGLQKWVSTPMTGVSTGSGSYDVSSYKAYFLKIGNTRMAFRVKFPKTWNDPGNEDKLYPAMTFFHGAGEFACNSNNGFYNNEKQLVHGGKLFRDRVDNGSFDGFLVYPQVNTATNNCWGTWPGGANEPFIIITKFLDSLAKYVRLDINRNIAVGLSAGGGAAWNAAAGQPRHFAKSAPSAASAPGSVNFANLVHIPVWFATGGKDTNPLPSSATASYNNLRNAGGDVRFTLYPNAGHGVWGTHWNEPDFLPFMNSMHKANPVVYFQRDVFCPEDPINARIGVTAGFHSYEWQKDGVTIATRINGTNTVIDGSSLISFEGNEIVVKQFGSYSVRIRRTASGDWSVFSPKPAVIGPKDVTQTPDITVSGINSKVLPALNNQTTVPLTLPSGFAGYQWFNADTEQLLGSEQIFNAPVGRYKAKVVEEYGCGTLFSPVFTVIPAGGTPNPDPAKNLSASAISQIAVKLDWNENPNAGNNETGFEIYRGSSKTGPFTLMHITAPNVVTWTDNALTDNTTFYYVVRAVNQYGASVNSNVASVTTLTDNIPPNPPGNLLYRGSTQNSVSLKWTAATDNGIIERYDVYANGTKLFSTAETSISVFGLDSLTNYTFTVKAVDKAGNVSQNSNQVTGFTHRQGLNYKYYQKSFDLLPNFNDENVTKSGIAQTIDIGASIRNVADNYAFYWEGYIYIPYDGTYTFYTRSDDGSKLYINTPYSFNATALVNNDGLHGSQERSGNITLTRGYHQIIATFFEKTGGEVMEVSWQNTAVGITKEVIPGGFYALAPATLPSLPIAPTGVSVSQHSYNQLNISWNDVVPNETGFEIVRSTSANGTYVPVTTVAAGVSFYRDSSLNPSTTYHYKVRSINAGGSSPFAGPANAATAAAPAAPATPTNLAAIVGGRDLITLSFTDNSSNETGFELWRSVNNTNEFRIIANIPAASGGQVNYADTGLFANVTYYYRVRAKGLTNFSGYTATVNGRTLNTAPVSDKPLDFGVKYNTTMNIEINATDIDGDGLTFNTVSKPSFVTISTISNGKVNLKISPRLSNTGAHSVYLIVDDGFQGYDTTFFSFVVNDNTVPTLQPISNVTLKEGALLSIPVTGFDADGLDGLFWLTEGLPSFASFEDLGNGSGLIHLQPDYSQSGTYPAMLRLDDGYGSWAARSFTITVEEKDPNEVIQANMRYFTGSVQGWNDIALPQNPNVSTPQTYFNVSNMLNTRGEESGIGLTVLSGTYSSSQNGTLTGNNSGVYPDNVIRDQMNWGFFAGNNVSDTIRLKAFGLNQQKVYNFVFFGSYNCAGCGNINSQTTYKILDQEAVVKYYTNTSATDTIYNVSPDENGEVIITMIGDGNVNFGGVLNALVIDARYDDGTTPSKPLNLSGSFIENTGVRLEWIDRSYNESNYQVYRSLTPAGPFTHINTSGVYIDSTGYNDNQVETLTDYYYYVIGVNSYGNGVSSDTVMVTTGNNIPTITSIADIFVKTNTSAFREFTVEDDPGDVLDVFVVNRPSFITLTNQGGGVYRITFDPTVNNLGLLNLTVGVRDDKGGEAFTSFNLFVADKDTRSVFINFGSVGKAAPAPWNNFLGSRTTNSQMLNLRDENNINTGFSIRTIQRMPALADMGHLTGNDSGIYPDAVLESAAASNLATPSEFRIANLNPNLRYNISLVGSMNEGTGYRAKYSSPNLTDKNNPASANQVDTLDAMYNTTKSANLNGLYPNNQGEIYVLIERLDGGYMYLNAMVVEEYNPAIQVLSPINLFAEAVNRTTIDITWSDRSFNENANGGFVLERALNESFSSGLQSIALPANTDRYRDGGLTPNTKYWYRVKAVNGTTDSEYSNIKSAVTPQTVVSVNFNFQVPNGPFPWNNLQASPEDELEYLNMIDHSGFNSGIRLDIVKGFNGENTAGRQLNNTGIAPDLVLASSYWIDNTQEAQIKISGLNHSKRYRVGFFGSMSTNGWYRDNYTATYSIGDRTVYLNSWNNYTKIVYIENVAPNASGEIFLDFSTTELAAWGFNGGLLIEAYNDDVAPAIQGQTILNNNTDELLQGREADAVNAANTAAVSMYPNPFRDFINLDFNNTASGNVVSVDVLDLSGRLAYRKDFGQLSAGMQTLRLNTAEARLGTGVYLITLKVNGKPVQASKMIRTNR